MRALVVIALLSACGGSTATTNDAAVDAPVTNLTCTTGDATKLKFTPESSCANDGSVEFCIPDNDPSLAATLGAISPSVHCAAGGGRANCARTPGLLLCSYPTAFPAQCATDHGAMTAEVWGDMCQLSALSQITEIVPTILE